MQRTSPIVRLPGFAGPGVLGAGALIVAAVGATNHRIEFGPDEAAKSAATGEA